MCLNLCLAPASFLVRGRSTKTNTIAAPQYNSDKANAVWAEIPNQTTRPAANIYGPSRKKSTQAPEVRSNLILHQPFTRDHRVPTRAAVAP